MKHNVGDLVMAREENGTYSVGYIIAVELFGTLKGNHLLYTVQWNGEAAGEPDVDEYSAQQIKIYKDVLKEYKARMVER